MDTRSLHSKHPKKMKTNKDQHEVFVLPPDLLKKLGISIGNINGSQVIPDDVNGSQSTGIINNEHIENNPAFNCSQKSSDVSILETASLMKKSVFLSPTFVSTIANAIPGEVEISNKNITDDAVDLTDVVEPEDIFIDPADSIETTLLCGSNDIQEGDLNVDQYNITLNGEQTSQPNINQEYPCMSLDGNKNQKVDFNVTFDVEEINKLENKVGNGLDDNHSFESENNVEFNSTATDSDSACVSFNINTNNILVPEASEIDIISEDTIPLSKLKEIKRLQSLNGKKNKPVTVQSIIDTKIDVEKGNSGPVNIMESNSTVPENTEILHPGELKSGENANENYLKYMDSNELEATEIEATAVFSVVSSNKVEEPRIDITSNVLEKDISKNRTLSWESTDKDSIDFNEDNTNKVMNDCAYNAQNKTSQDDASSKNSTTVNGFHRNEEFVTIDVDKNVTICNGQMDGCTEPADGFNEQHPFAESEHKCNNDNKEEDSSVPETTGVEEHSVVKDNIKQTCDNNQNTNLKNILESDTKVTTKLIDHKSSSENGEDKTLDDELARILNASKNLSSAVTDIKVDKVKEIAAYLRKFSHIYTDKKKTKTALSNAKKDKIKSDKNTIESKLCIQGVEKPGGKEVDREHTETIDHDMVDTAKSKNSDTITSIEKPLNTDINDNNNAAGSKHISTGLSTSQPKFTPSSASKTGLLEISSVLDKASKDDSGDKEKPYQRRQSSSNENTFLGKEIQLDTPKANNKTDKKRSLSGKATPGSEPAFKKSVKCALCNNIFSGAEWESHVANQHHLIAWRVGGFLNLDDPELGNKLKERLKTVGMLECSICTMQIKKFSRFMEHIKYCIGKKLSNADKKSAKPARKSRTALDENVTCGVCQRTMPSSKWLEHIGSLHDYLAWKQGQESLNLENESEVWQHLQNIIRLNGCLICYKCGLQRSRVKTYQAHIKTCDGNRVCLDESTMSVDLNSSTAPEDITVEQSAADPTSVKCGVCGEEVAHSDWIDHISKEHNYLAWQEGETPLNLQEEEAVWNHLQQLIRQNGGLTCHKCGLVRKRVKLYLTHVEMCDGTNTQADNSSNNISLNTAQTTDGWFELPVVEQQERKIVKCGVCSEEVPILEWLQHVRKEHDYLAWQDGAQPLDLENEMAVKMHLLDVSKQSGGLVCNKCEKRMKYPKTYLQHTKECTGPAASPEKMESPTLSWIESLGNKQIKDEIFTCAVCADKVESENWIKHISAKHEYLAWPEGEPPLNLEDPVAVQKHLNDITKVVGGLMCMKCGVRRKYVKSYLLHVETCQGKVEPFRLSFALMSQDIVECAVCGATMDPKYWRDHAMIEHYNIAWVVGDNPIEINNPYAVESYLKEYHQAKNKLVCKVCKISRVSYVGFYAHIIVCGKTEKETEIYKSVCELCNNKYLRIYKSQHMTMHREKEYVMERKLLAAKEKALKKEEDTGEDVTIPPGRRKAAEKAKNVIEKYKSNFHDGTYSCPKCGFNSEVEKELADHVCVVNKWGDVSDTDESVKYCSSNESEESDESDIDSNVSDEEREAREASSCKKKKHSDSSSSKICRLPYPIPNISSYMKRSTEEFIATYLTDEDLYPMWHTCDIEEVPEDEVMKYMPPIEDSCKVRFDENQDWVTFKRLESSRVKDTLAMFVGASIQCMSWVPPAADPERAASEAAQLCAVPHAGRDAPRLAWDGTRLGPGLIQIWDCGNLITTTPRFALGIAHDFGTVWAIDWCPSGARDAFTLKPSPGNIHRLGLMAAACSNGLAYIFAVPYPTSISEKVLPFYKLKPVVELRLSGNENRKVYQATAIKWSLQKGHSHVVVGYADGTTAYYDLNGESPLLRTTEGDRTVFYPYHDERVQNSCIEDVDIYPSGAGASARAGGVVCVGSAGGAGAGPLQSHVAASNVLFPPHWPAALLAGDDCLVTQSINELEWWGGGRRLGGACGAAGCAWCARLAAAAPPLLKLLRVHPAFPDLHKQVIGRIMMIPLGAKRKRQNDELGMIVEPITYSDAVKKYGVEFKHITARDRTTQQKLSATPRDIYPERFPLSDVAAMQFCPTFKQHHKLALAMHAGLIFIINV